MITLKLSPIINLTDQQFFELASRHRELRIERSQSGELIIMPPVGGGGSKRNADLTTDLNIWNRQTKLGVVFDSSGGFSLPSGGDRSPDASWLKIERWHALTTEEQEKFLPLCPDFVIELRSASDRLKPLQEKMQEYMNSGLRLGWLINPKDSNVEIYRQGQEKEVLRSPLDLSGEDVLPGFLLNLSSIITL